MNIRVKALFKTPPAICPHTPHFLAAGKKMFCDSFKGERSRAKIVTIYQNKIL
jgi:hypothetical protein